eukprot:6043103-Pyramimonas_sp.AAC.1
MGPGRMGWAVGRMQRGGDDARTTGPHWGPAGNARFPQIRLRGARLDQRDHRRHGPLPTGRGTTAWSG